MFQLDLSMSQCKKSCFSHCSPHPCELLGPDSARLCSYPSLEAGGLAPSQSCCQPDVIPAKSTSCFQGTLFLTALQRSQEAANPASNLGMEVSDPCNVAQGAHIAVRRSHSSSQPSATGQK